MEEEMKEEMKITNEVISTHGWTRSKCHAVSLLDHRSFHISVYWSTSSQRGVIDSSFWSFTMTELPDNS